MANVNLYTSEINDVVKQRGHNCYWERAVVCTCVSRDTGQPDFTCPVCGGSGYRYLAPRKIKVAVTSLSSSYNLQPFELREPGTAYVTPTEDIIMGYKDRLMFPDFKCVFSEVLKFNFEEDGQYNSPKTYRNIKEVIFLADNEKFLEPEDYKIISEGHQIQLNNQSIDAEKFNGKSLSLLYYTTPSYLVTDLLHELRATLSDQKTSGLTFRELPKQYKVNREDFVYRVKNKDNTDYSKNLKADEEDNSITI